jgi:hypothetical protein
MAPDYNGVAAIGRYVTKDQFGGILGGRAFQRGDPYVGFAWNLRVMIYTADARVRYTV